MILPGEIREGNGQIQFSLRALDTSQLQPKLKLSCSNPAPSFTRKEIHLSISQVLVGSLSALSTFGLLLRAIIKLWLFE